MTILDPKGVNGEEGQSFEVNPRMLQNGSVQSKKLHTSTKAVFFGEEASTYVSSSTKLNKKEKKL